MKNFFIIVLIVAVIAISIYAYGKIIFKKFNWGQPAFAGADFKNIFSGTGFTTVTFVDTITNNNNFQVSIDRLYIEVYYGGSLIAKSTNVHEKFVIPANGSVTITQNMTLAINNSLGILSDLAQGNKLQFEYRVRALIFGLYPLMFKGNFSY